MDVFQTPEMAWATIIVAYLLGSIPFGLLFSRYLAGKDPREHGSGNIGATNALRTSGKKVGILTLLADIGKGALAVAMTEHLQQDEVLIAAVALAAFLGHVFPIYLKFKGGKGVATMFGVLMPWLPWVALAIFVCWLSLFKATRYVSLASVVAGIMLPLVAWLFGVLQWSSDHASALWVCMILGALMVLRHAGNLKRLWAGEEPKTGA